MPQFKPPVNLGPKINTSAYESDPFLTYDGKKLFFVRGFGIWFSEWTDTGWTNPLKLGPQINCCAGTQSPSVSPDGQKLYFVADALQGTFWDIWVCTWDSVANDWGTPVNAQAPVNSAGAEYSARIAPDGNHLYIGTENGFIQDTSNWHGCRCGIYVSQWNGSSWSNPVNVGNNINMATNAGYPSITADGLWLYFAWQDGFFGYVSRWTGTQWGPATYIGGKLGGAYFPFITPSGDSLFYSSSQAGGFGNSDIWLAERIVPPKVPSLGKEFLLLLILVLILTGIYWTKDRST